MCMGGQFCTCTKLILWLTCIYLWVKGFAHYIAFGGSKVAKTTFSTFIILAHEGPNGEQLKF